MVPFMSSAQDAETLQGQDFDTWDGDGDGYINDQEFDAGLNKEGKYFNLYDSNSDGMVDDAEWGTASRTYDYLESDYYSTWDADEDGYLNQEEVVGGAYETWDTNKNGKIERLEYDDRYADWNP